MRLLLLLVLSLTLNSLSAATCTPTPAMHRGTHYQPITQEKSDLGTGLVVSGTILSARDCQPIAGAKISRWQTSAAGVYEDRFYAYLFSNDQGHYRYHTEWPGAPVPHLHFIVEADGYKTLTTQWIGETQRDRIRFDIVLQPE